MQGGMFVCSAAGGDGDAAVTDDATRDDAPPLDAPRDASTVDSDNDGLFDDEDNCPVVANAAQTDEDGDARGDACDGCPPIADTTADDGDGDGVEDACDPNPTTAGDKLVLFEGFAAGLPATWTEQGAWTAANGSVSADPGSNETAYIASPLSTISSATASAGVVPGAPTMALQGVSIAVATNPPRSNGVTCAMFSALTASSREAGLVTASGTPVDYGAYAWADANAYTLRIRRDDTSYTCDVSGAVGNAQFTGSNGSAGPQLHVASRGVPIRVDWVLYVESP